MHREAGKHLQPGRRLFRDGLFTVVFFLLLHDDSQAAHGRERTREHTETKVERSHGRRVVCPQGCAPRGTERWTGTEAGREKTTAEQTRAFSRNGPTAYSLQDFIF